MVAFTANSIPASANSAKIGTVSPPAVSTGGCPRPAPLGQRAAPSRSIAARLGTGGPCQEFCESHPRPASPQAGGGSVRSPRGSRLRIHPPPQNFAPSVRARLGPHPRAWQPPKNWPRREVPSTVGRCLWARCSIHSAGALRNALSRCRYVFHSSFHPAFRRPSSRWAWSSGRSARWRPRTMFSNRFGAIAMAFTSASFASTV